MVAVSITPIRADRDSRTRKIAASLGRSGFRSVLVEAAPSQKPSTTPFFRLESIRERPVNISNTSTPLRRVRSLLRLIEDRLLLPAARLPRADVYYLHSYHQYPGLALRTRATKTPIVYDAHDFYGALGDRHRLPGWRRRLEQAIEARCVQRAAVVVTVSDGVADLYEKNFGRRPKVVRNAHDPRLDAPAKKSIRQVLHLDNDAFVVVHVGQSKPDIPTATVIQAAARITTDPVVHFVFLGDGFGQDHKEAAIRAGVGDRVHFIPAVAPDEVVSFIRDADAAAILYVPTNASVMECLPNGFFQSIAAGLPVLFSSQLPMVADHLDGAGVLVHADDPGSIAEAVERLASDHELRRTCRSRSLELAQRYSWANEEQRLEEVMNAALTAGRPSSQRQRS